MRLLALTLLLSGCTTLQARVDDDVRDGDDYAHVKDVLGLPDAVVKLADAMHVATYRSRQHTCMITFKDSLVILKLCEVNADYVPALAVMLKAIGDGMTKRRDEFTCTDAWNDGNLRCQKDGITYMCTKLGDTIQCR